MKRVYAVIHHGGSGTTHMGLKNGCSSLIVPHIIDQFAWNRLVHRIGAGPKGISIHKMTAPKIKGLIRSLYIEEKYKANAEKIAESMAREDLEDRLIRFVLE
ncbi:MAG: hypothetical protein GVX96_02915 [Bacteroidetes bacterium]|nr:hypothetical protein [Bacteroidota bacterium]